ncbi:DNA recombination protein RmuC [Chakrabartia godavariana]|nr:DNA recombination protein RmuC [Chakrabartia godavariana]
MVAGTAIQILAILLLGLGLGGVVGWLWAGRSSAAVSAERDAARAERDRATADFKAAIVDLEAAVSERNTLKETLAAVSAEQRAREEAHAAQVRSLQEAKEALSAQFSEVGGKLLESAQKQFLERAEARFRQSEETTGQGLKALLQPVHERLQKYEEQVSKVEAERRDAFGLLHGQIAAMREGTERVSSEAAKLVNALRNAPKARGRWGEQQLRNVLESCGLSDHVDFVTEVSVSDGDGGRLRPDVIVRVPGGNSLVIDAKVSLNAYQDAFGAVDEQERQVQLTAHAAAMKAHVNALGNKAYWSQFDDAPDYVIMFVPGEHFLTAALEQDAQLWDYAFDRKVLLATPTNLIAIARTVSAVWKQEKMAGQAREIAELGRELYSRLATMGGHVSRVGKNLDTAVNAYNQMVGSLESQVMSSAHKFEKLGIDTGAKSIEALPVVEGHARPLVKLVANSGENDTD